MMKTSLIIAILLVACSRAPNRPDPETPVPPTIAERYAEAAGRIDPTFLDGGWIVSRGAGGEAEQIGDSLIWSGIALAALPCEAPAAAIESALASAIHERGGALERHPSLPDDVSLDGALGLYFGAASRSTRCDKGTWAAVIAEHEAFIDANDGRLNPATGAKLELDFSFVLDTLAFRLGERARPDASRQAALEGEIAAWALATTTTHSACFRIHLGWLALRTIELAGGTVSAAGRDAFCVASAGSDLPIVDNWCGRGDLKGWIDAFRYNVWEYRHQRCGGWEQPDAKGTLSPAIDYLIAIREVYGVP